jgi:hypothetical protein
MPGELEPIKLGNRDLFSPQVEAYLSAQSVLQQRDVPETKKRSWLVRVLFSSCLYLSIAGGIGALLAWLCLEPFIDETNPGQDENLLVNLLIFPTVAACVGLVLGAAEGLICRNPQRALISAAVGLGIGFAGGIVAIFAAEFLFNIMVRVSLNLWKDPQPGKLPTGLAFLVLMMGRGAAWAVAAIPAGIGQGVALRERKVVINGLLGGVLGGLLGGLLFDPINLWFTKPDGEAIVSRAVGFTVIGLMVGLFVGIVEQWTKTAWLLMKAGSLAGKQFIVHKNPTVLGSSPKADIYLFKDPAIEPRHALIHDRGGRYEIEDLQSADGTYVNGVPIQKRVLQAGDQIVMGKTVLEFALRDAN